MEHNMTIKRILDICIIATSKLHQSKEKLQFSKELQFRRLLLSKKNNCAKTAEEL